LAKELFISNFSFKVVIFWWKMGESNQNENLISIEENETNEKEMNIEEHVERVESGNVQIENSRVEENGEQKKKKNCKNYMFKEKIGEAIIEILYVGHFIV
jgi:hypothetical protein